MVNQLAQHLSVGSKSIANTLAQMPYTHFVHTDYPVESATNQTQGENWMSLDWDIEELAGYAMGKTEDGVEKMINDSTVDDELFDKYEIDFETYVKIVKDLLPLTPQVKAGISGDIYNAFVDTKNMRMIVKQKSGITPPIK